MAGNECSFQFSSPICWVQCHLTRDSDVTHKYQWHGILAMQEFPTSNPEVLGEWTPEHPRIYPYKIDVSKKKINDQMPRKTRTPYLPGIDIYQGIHKHCRLQSPKKTPNKYGIRMNHGTVPIYLKLATPRLGSCFIFFPRMYLEYLTNAWFLGKNCGESFFGW